MKDIKNMSDKEKMEAINKFLADIDCLEPLYRWINDLNIFNVLKLDRVEIRHSNMLAWLLNPHESHGLDDKLLKKILIQASNEYDIEIMNGLTPIDVEVMDLDDVVVSREYPTLKNRRIDILIVSEKNKLVVAFENKIDSGELDRQLEDYKEFLQKKYSPKDYKFVLIYLTPNGIESSDNENWVSIDYKFVLEQIENLIKTYQISSKAKLYIEDYTKAIRRSVVKENKEIEEICRKIYSKHRDVLDLVFEYKPDLCSRVSDYIYNFLKENEEEFQISVWEKHYKNTVRFTPKKLNEVYGHMGNGKWDNQQNLIGFEFYIGENYGVKIWVIIGPADSQYEEYRRKLFNKAIEYEHDFHMQSKKYTGTWKTIDKHDFVKKDQFDKLLQDNYEVDDEVLKTMVAEPIEKYMRNTMPKIVKDLLEAFEN